MSFEFKNEFSKQRAFIHPTSIKISLPKNVGLFKLHIWFLLGEK